MIDPINERLKQLRIDAGLSQEQLSARMGRGGYTKQAISSIENGHRSVGWSVIARWAEACNKVAEIVFKDISKEE